MTEYVIKAFFKDKDNVYRFISILPYVFAEEPVNVCGQLNEMLSPIWKHMIDIRK